jgi:hypothetical protein
MRGAKGKPGELRSNVGIRIITDIVTYLNVIVLLLCLKISSSESRVTPIISRRSYSAVPCLPINTSIMSLNPISIAVAIPSLIKSRSKDKDSFQTPSRPNS